jgi:hypothetical protein
MKRPIAGTAPASSVSPLQKLATTHHLEKEAEN